jgi:uncharacterized membrane protein
VPLTLLSNFLGPRLLPAGGLQVVTTSNPSAVFQAPETATKTYAAPTRVVSVDLLRGLVMVLMALDHTRDYFTNITFQPEDVSRTYPALFITRFVTHFCAPVFFLLAGTGAYLALSRGKTLNQVSRFFWTRGLWLVLLEFTVMGFGWSFVPGFGFAGVIWALGWPMVLMAAIVRMPVKWVAVFGVVMIVGHNLLDSVQPESFGKLSGLWMVLHSPGFLLIKPPATGVLVLYPLIPWVGVMACGYALGVLLERPDRGKMAFRLGAALTVVFFILRGINHYGNGSAGLLAVGPWTKQPTLASTVISFFDVLKYPPSLDIVLVTIGPALMALALFEPVQEEDFIARILLVYGRVPLFYYVLHIYLLHLMAIVVAVIFRQPVSWLVHGALFTQSTPPGYGHDLPFIYLVWIVAVALLHYPCRRYMEFRRRHRDWNWLSYF